MPFLKRLNCTSAICVLFVLNGGCSVYGSTRGLFLAPPKWFDGVEYLSIMSVVLMKDLLCVSPNMVLSVVSTLPGNRCDNVANYRWNSQLAL